MVTNAILWPRLRDLWPRLRAAWDPPSSRRPRPGPSSTQQLQRTLPPRSTRNRKLPFPYPRSSGVSDPPVFRAPHHPTAPRWGVTWSPESPHFTLAWGRGRFGRLRPKSVRSPPVDPAALADRNLKFGLDRNSLPGPQPGSLKPAAQVPVRRYLAATPGAPQPPRESAPRFPRVYRRPLRSRVASGHRPNTHCQFARSPPRTSPSQSRLT